MTPSKDFLEGVVGAQGRMRVMQSRLVRMSNSRNCLVPEALEELATSLEELQVAEEVLRQQNEELEQTHAAVEAERLRYEELFQFAPDGYLVTDPEGIIREANQAA